MSKLSGADRIVALGIAVVSVLMMIGARAIFAGPRLATSTTAHAYIP
jgi:hypothetical protein